MIDDYQAALNFIHGRTKFKKIPTLDRMKRFLAELGNPQDGLTYIHVTGTNGKGSTVAMVRDALIGQGLTVGTFTSPFITRFNERIQYQGQPIADDDLVRLTRRVQLVVEKLDRILPTGGPTEFEIDTAIMFCYMAEKKPDVVILEVGIGGLYDSTNVIVPKVSVITTVGWDHMKYLGNTLSAIAHQKAGIIKGKVPVVIGKLPSEAHRVIVNEAANLNAPVYEEGVDFNVRKVNQHGLISQIIYDGIGLHHFASRLGLPGDYQVENAAVAITIVQLFMAQENLPLAPADLKQSLAATTWPGRMEIVSEEPTVILDGAHNLPGIQALVNTIHNDLGDRDVYLLVAILADKQYDLMLGELASLGNVHIMVTNFAGPSANRPSADLDDITADIRSRYPIKYAKHWQRGLQSIATQLSADDVLIVTGSLYFISEVRHLFKD